MQVRAAEMPVTTRRALTGTLVRGLTLERKREAGRPLSVGGRGLVGRLYVWQDLDAYHVQKTRSFEMRLL